MISSFVSVVTSCPTASSTKVSKVELLQLEICGRMASVYICTKSDPAVTAFSTYWALFLKTRRISLPIVVSWSCYLIFMEHGPRVSDVEQSCRTASAACNSTVQSKLTQLSICPREPKRIDYRKPEGSFRTCRTKTRK
jgi:hypothetical protein